MSTWLHSVRRWPIYHGMLCFSMPGNAIYAFTCLREARPWEMLGHLFLTLLLVAFYIRDFLPSERDFNA